MQFTKFRRHYDIFNLWTTSPNFTVNITEYLHLEMYVKFKNLSFIINSDTQTSNLDANFDSIY
jgi:hypothetical protein